MSSRTASLARMIRLPAAGRARGQCHRGTQMLADSFPPSPGCCLLPGEKGTHSCVHADSIARHHSAKLILLQYSSHGTNENSCRPRSGEGAAQGQVLEAKKILPGDRWAAFHFELHIPYLFVLATMDQTWKFAWRSTLSAASEG